MPALDPEYVHFNMRASGVQLLPNGKHLIKFENSMAVEADVVIGCDGIKSTMRPYIAGSHLHKQLASANTVTYRAMISIAALEAAGVKTDLKRPLLWVGPDQVRLFPSCYSPLPSHAHFDTAHRHLPNQRQ